MTEEETERLQGLVATMDDGEVSAALEALAARELALLGNPAFASGEIREMTLANAAALCAAAERLALSRARTAKPASGT